MISPNDLFVAHPGSKDIGTIGVSQSLVPRQYISQNSCTHAGFENSVTFCAYKYFQINTGVYDYLSQI